MIQTLSKKIELTDLIEMLGSMARLDFSKRLHVAISEDPVDVIAYGLNMLSEELESNVVKRSLLEETNTNLERFSYTVAHDIRSPFNSALALMHLIEDELKGSDNKILKEYFSLLKNINEGITEMVSGILEYSKTNFDDLQTEAIDIQKICAEVVDEYGIYDNTTVSYSLNVPTVYYNRIALKQIFSNLTGNAIKHNDKSNCIVEIASEEKDDYCQISVSDNGPGIKGEDIARVFDLYENFKSEKTHSYGIGLSIVKKLITQAGGNIWVESKPGEGAKFIFTIPNNRKEY